MDEPITEEYSITVPRIFRTDFENFDFPSLKPAARTSLKSPVCTSIPLMTLMEEKKLFHAFSECISIKWNTNCLARAYNLTSQVYFLRHALPLNMCIYIYICVCMCVCVYVCENLCVCLCMYVCIYVGVSFLFCHIIKDMSEIFLAFRTKS